LNLHTLFKRPEHKGFTFFLAAVFLLMTFNELITMPIQTPKDALDAQFKELNTPAYVAPAIVAINLLLLGLGVKGTQLMLISFVDKPGIPTGSSKEHRRKGICFKGESNHAQRK